MGVATNIRICRNIQSRLLTCRYVKSKQFETANFLPRKINTLFPHKETKNYDQLVLESYSVENHEQEPEHVSLAILKLSGANIEEFKKYEETRQAGFFRCS